MKLLLILLTALTGQQSIVEQYINDHAHLAEYTQMQYGVPASITLAQAIIESASGTSELATKANNHFGIRYFPGTYYTGPHHNGWRVYQTVQDSYIDHALFFINNPQCEWPYGKDYKVWARVLQICKYAGEDPGYDTAIINTIHQYNLTRFDL